MSLVSKKIYLFLFFILFGGVFFFLLYGWNIWQERMILQNIEAISRSESIENLLKGKLLQGESDEDFTKFIQESVNNPALPNYSDDTVNMALREIFLVQGKNGFEQWRLKASWATLRENTAILNLNEPIFIYNTLSTEGIESNKADVKTELVVLESFLQNDKNKSVNLTPENFYNNSEDMLILTAEVGILFDENSKLSLIKKVLAKQEDNFVQGELMQYDDNTKLIVFPDSANFGGKNIIGKADELTWIIEKNMLQGQGNIEITWEVEPE